MSNTKEYFGKGEVLEEERTHRVKGERLSRRDGWQRSPYIDFFRDRFIAYHLWGHPGNGAGEGHLGTFVTELLRCAKI